MGVLTEGEDLYDGSLLTNSLSGQTPFSLRLSPTQNRNNSIGKSLLKFLKWEHEEMMANVDLTSSDDLFPQPSIC